MRTYSSGEPKVGGCITSSVVFCEGFWFSLLFYRLQPNAQPVATREVELSRPSYRQIVRVIQKWIRCHFDKQIPAQVLHIKILHVSVVTGSIRQSRASAYNVYNCAKAYRRDDSSRCKIT
jgi:hypothetical protein